MSWKSTSVVLMYCISAALHANTDYLSEFEFPENTTLEERIELIANEEFLLSPEMPLNVRATVYSDVCSLRISNDDGQAGVTLKFAQDADGHNMGYLAYLTKISGWTGSQMLDAADQLYAYIKPERVFLWDASSKYVDPLRIELRPFRVLTHDTGLAWYESHGYRPAHWSEVLEMERHDGMGMTHGSLEFDADSNECEPELYLASRQYLHGLKLADLMTLKDLRLVSDVLVELEEIYDPETELSYILLDLMNTNPDLFQSCWDQLLNSSYSSLNWCVKCGISAYEGEDRVMCARIKARSRYDKDGYRPTWDQLTGAVEPKAYMRVLLKTPVVQLCEPFSTLLGEIYERKLGLLTLQECVSRLTDDEIDELLMPLVAQSALEFENTMTRWLESPDDGGTFVKIVFSLQNVKQKYYFVKDIAPIEDAA